jgi:hypothetical protein
VWYTNWTNRGYLSRVAQGNPPVALPEYMREQGKSLRSLVQLNVARK